MRSVESCIFFWCEVGFGCDMGRVWKTETMSWGYKIVLMKTGMVVYRVVDNC